MDAKKRQKIVSAFGSMSSEEAHRCFSSLRLEGAKLVLNFLSDLSTSTNEDEQIALMRIVGTLAFLNDYHDAELLKDYRKSLGKTSSAKKRATWVKNLGKIGGPEVLDELLGHFDDRDPRVRANAVEGLAFLVKRTKISGGQAVAEILQSMLNSSNTRIRINAALALFFIHRLEAEGLYCYLRHLSLEGDSTERLSANRAIDAFALNKEGSANQALEQFGEDSIYYLLTRYNLTFFD